MSGGKLLTPEEQINHLKERGISFQLYSEEEARIFLQENSYFTKVLAYRKNYQKHPAGPAKDDDVSRSRTRNQSRAYERYFG